jgi:hypothetical protein
MCEWSRLYKEEFTAYHKFADLLMEHFFTLSCEHITILHSFLQMHALSIKAIKETASVKRSWW